MRISHVVNYYEAAAQFEIPPQEALDFFLSKGLSRSFRWDQMLSAEHDVAFTVAKLMNGNLLEFVKNELDKVLANGETFDDFAEQVMPALQRAGWWGKRDVIDPLSGDVIEARIGTASRLETIFRTNLQSAYAKGQWQNIQETKDSFPYLMYDAVDDSRTRPEHAQWDGLVLPADHPFWETHYPPNGYNCRCGVIQLSWADLDAYGLSVSEPPPVQWLVHEMPDGRQIRYPEGVDPTFA
ncbi:phage minor head protein [Idiomarina xiamenensis]|uniref:Phage putative head morphogenesis protein, SPP1 gp7 n=1 Tax=Idiomarina xiamenensis 10-D-4 TaxID=740709 RepID=K2JYQ5_9GAMM|nr:phage minor head protein [Idiomarina xiamenensis]EKE79712.1 phage putative head morphogenesis protein, SPP1 gp7 [Idiomarina xiamenensis 10-D-4]